MASAFDPSAFIDAERRERKSQAVAAGCDPSSEWAFEAKPSENRHSATPLPEAVATIATVAAAAPQFSWSSDLARFEAMPCPEGMQEEAWDELVNEAVVISRKWGATALACGWTVHDLFGCNPKPFARRLDRDGLVATIAGFTSPLKITSLTAECAVLQEARGAVLRYRPGNRTGQALLWEAYDMKSGP
jgi:hypothetical protein